MLDAHGLTTEDLRGLAPEAKFKVEHMLAQIAAQSKLITEQAQAIQFKDTKLKKVCSSGRACSAGSSLRRPNP
ncbi:hypothetical protein [Variovorax saccharolyticus]|uniref:hypothetical protein n=1 Tax=Variovorax saccharolyticus TaxID=3053516 RepID=UPI00257805C2|nr:hypothetical protein [Variovorax sp. J31P216]MDM0029907.1 hypothetical protein [Variovorax sp. J31P216]